MLTAVHWLLLVSSFLFLHANAEEVAFDVRRHLSTVTRSSISNRNLSAYACIVRKTVFMALAVFSMV